MGDNQMLIWIALALGCEPAHMIVTDNDYEDSGESPPDPVIDEDGDGYELAEDCDDSNPAVHPDAVEACNGHLGGPFGLGSDVLVLSPRVLARTLGDSTRTLGDSTKTSEPNPRPS